MAGSATVVIRSLRNDVKTALRAEGGILVPLSISSVEGTVTWVRSARTRPAVWRARTARASSGA